VASKGFPSLKRVTLHLAISPRSKRSDSAVCTFGKGPHPVAAPAAGGKPKKGKAKEGEAAEQNRPRSRPLQSRIFTDQQFGGIRQRHTLLQLYPSTRSGQT